MVGLLHRPGPAVRGWDIGVVSGWSFGGEYFAGYLTEKALSVDNLFVFLLVMTAFAVPRAFQQKVLLIGIAIALVMRGIFIAVGATLIANFSWIFYLFGALLLLLAYRQAFTHGESNPANGRFMLFVRRHLPVTDDYHGDKLTVVKDGRRFVTPMLLVLVTIGFVDLILCGRLDSGDLRPDRRGIHRVHRERFRSHGSCASCTF